MTGALAVLVAAGGWFAVARHGPSTGAGRPGAGAASEVNAAPDPRAVARAEVLAPLLDARAAAVLHGDVTGWVRRLDAAAGFRAAEAARAEDARSLGPTTWHGEILATSDVTPDGPAGPATGGATGEAFEAKIRTRYRLPGDAADVVVDERWTLRRAGSAWLLGAVTPTSSPPPPWRLGRLTVRRGARSLVVGLDVPSDPHDPAAARLRRTVAEVDAAATRVDRFWERGGPAIVIVPRTAAQAAALLGRSDAVGMDRLTALTRSEGVGTTSSGVPVDRVILNPSAFARLSDLGRRVVLAHELTHLRTRRSARVPRPTWVEEGFAGYVGYAGSGLPPGVVASDVLPAVRAGTARPALPGAADFDARHGEVASAYADAWLAFDLMRRQGADRPARFYRVAAGLTGEPADRALAAAFRQVLGTTPEAFAVRWRAYRSSLARDAA